jgi:hypothetical protein
MNPTGENGDSLSGGYVHLCLQNFGLHGPLLMRYNLLGQAKKAAPWVFSVTICEILFLGTKPGEYTSSTRRSIITSIILNVFSSHKDFIYW